MSDDPQKPEPESPDAPTPPAPPAGETKKKPRITLDIDEVDTSEVLERKISA